MSRIDGRDISKKQWASVFANPIWMKCARSRLRMKHVLSWGLITVSITAFACLLVYFVSIEEGVAEMDAARAMMIPIVIIQGGLMMLLGTGSVSSAISQEREDRLLDYQRMTPMSPTGKIIGYLFGLPVREYVLFLFTLPFLGFAIVKGQLEFGTMLHFYGVFFTSVWLYHMTGLVVGMVSAKPRRASIMAQGFILLLYLVLPNLTFVGLDFFRYLTVLPTFENLVFEQINPDPAQVEALRRTSDLIPKSEEAFFNTTLHYTTYTLMVQMFLLIAMYVVVRRKWIDEFRHAYSKFDAAIIFAGVLTFLTGSVWPRVANMDALREFASDLGGELDAEGSAAIVVNIILFMWTMVVGGIAVFLIHLITPTRETMLKEWRRARKHGRQFAPWNSDGASSLPTTAFITVTSLLAGWLVVRHIMELKEVLSTYPSLGVCLTPLVLIASMLLFIQGVRERYGTRVTFVGVFLLWMAPLFTAIIMVSAWRLWVEGGYVALPFPPTSIYLSIANFLQEAVVMDGHTVELIPRELQSEVTTMLRLTMGGYVIGAIFVQVSLQRRRHALWKKAQAEAVVE